MNLTRPARPRVRAIRPAWELENLTGCLHVHAVAHASALDPRPAAGRCGGLPVGRSEARRAHGPRGRVHGAEEAGGSDHRVQERAPDRPQPRSGPLRARQGLSAQQPAQGGLLGAARDGPARSGEPGGEDRVCAARDPRGRARGGARAERGRDRRRPEERRGLRDEGSGAPGAQARGRGPPGVREGGRGRSRGPRRPPRARDELRQPEGLSRVPTRPTRRRSRSHPT